tara:strand:+ start:584 stop:1099 length:516 start_codon:yes stop_codon:yes gene_type:complete
LKIIFSIFNKRVKLSKLSLKELEEKVFTVQNLWADSIVKIGKAYIEKENYFDLTNRFLDKLYFFNYGKVLFKPTKASHKQFRNNKNEFISYFIGHNKVSDEDKGFALEPWKNIYFENFDILYLEKLLISMGNYFFTDYQDNLLKVEYTFGYMLDKNNNLKIIFHHSSLPYK